MALLQAVLKVLEPVVDDSPSTCQLYDTCRRFYQFAETVLLERGSGQSLKAMQGPSTAFNMFSGPAVPPIDSTQTMSQAEWEEIMQALEVELGAGASGAMAGDLDPFSQGWDS